MVVTGLIGYNWRLRVGTKPRDGRSSDLMLSFFKSFGGYGNLSFQTGIYWAYYSLGIYSSSSINGITKFFRFGCTLP